MKIKMTLGENASFLAVILGLAVMSCGCGDSADLSRSKATAELEWAAVTEGHYSNSIIAISGAQFDWAVKEGLFHKAAYDQFWPTDKGKSLGYREPVRFEPGTVAARGVGIVSQDPDLIHHWLLFLSTGTKLKLAVDDINGIADGQKPGTKGVTAKVRVKMPNACFPEPMPLWRAGPDFVPSRDLAFNFRHFDDGWCLEQ